MANEQYNLNASRAYSGVSTDTDYKDQPKGTTRFVLNGVNESSDGQRYSLSNEKGFSLSATIPQGFFIIGDEYLENNESVIILVNPETNRSQIGTISKDSEYNSLVDIGDFNLHVTNQCDIKYRRRRGSERVIYWVDGLNKPRSFNLDRAYNYYTTAYQLYLRAGGNPDTFVGEKFDTSAFNLVKSYTSIPFFTNIEVLESGSILPGSYNFAIQYVDDDLNPTEWITTSNTVNIYNDSTDTAYNKIRGSRNTDNAIQSFGRANKSIRLTLTNMDTSFPYYRVAIIVATALDGLPSSVLVSDIQSTGEDQFTYTGNDGSLTSGSLEDILIENEVIYAPNHIEQLENRLILASTRGKGENWCEYQRFASKIETDLATKDVILNSVLSEANIKNAKSTFMYCGYMPGQVYSFGIVYIFDDNTLSPVFHIPGKSISNLSSRMLAYEIDSNYLDIHNCSVDNYWSKDSQGNSLVGQNVRHHRFPFRKEANTPLFIRNGDTTVINKYRLSFTVTLNPLFVPSGSDEGGWPKDAQGNDLVIPAQIIYKTGSTGSTVTISRQLTSSDLGSTIIIYDDVDNLGDVSGTPDTIPIMGVIEEVLNIATGTLSDYTDVGGSNPRFLLNGVYEEYNASSVYNTDTSKIFGINFSNIERPNERVIGFYIVRNEKTDDDKIVIDNAIFGPMIENVQYKSFGLLMPKQYYPVTTVNGNCEPAGTVNAGKTLNYYDNGTWFFNPEYQFLGKKLPFTDINIQGQFYETIVSMPSRKAEYNGCVNWLGVYVEDVQAGTSFNPDINKGSDGDGFDLLVGYRNTEVNYQVYTYNFPDIERDFYLNAATYQIYENDVLYNVSCDNKIGVIYFDGTIDTNIYYNTANKRNSLLYGALTRENTSAYSNFMNRAYYKEHNNPFLFGSSTIINDVQVFNGDAYISPITITSSIYYDLLAAERKKKSRIWQIIVGAVLVVAGVVAAVFTAGAGGVVAAAGIGVLSAAAISYGVSLAMSGIKFEQFKSMIDNDYSKGLKETVTDGGVFETIRDNEARGDDTIRWFVDRVNSLYIESYLPVGLRDGITSGVTDFIDSPNQFVEDEFRSYVTEKLTTIDRDQGSGRLYKGYATAEFYSLNPDYLRKNKQKVFSHLPVEYDCCADDNENYSNRIWWSEQSFQEERIDNFRVFLPNNYRDIEGEHGEITDLYRLGNSLFVHCKEALWQLPQSVQERVTNEIVSFLGTGDFFSIPPRKVIDDSLGSGGTQHKWSSLKTKVGYFFINELENKIYLHGEGVKDLSSDSGLSNWFENNLKSFLSEQFYINIGVDYPNDNNPANPSGVGYISAYDTRYQRVIFTKRDYLYLGDFSKIIVGYDPKANYTPGQVIVDGRGFEEITDVSYAAPVSISMTGWTEEPIPNINPTLEVPATPTNPLRLNYGEVYQKNGLLYYLADSYEDIDFAGQPNVNDIISVDVGSCAPMEVEVVIPDIPSKRCPNFFTSGGQVAYQETKIVLGTQAGTVKFLLSTYTIPDAFKIYYGEPSDNILLWSSCSLPGSDADCLVATYYLAANPAYSPCPDDPKDDGNPYEVAITFQYPATDPEVQHVTLVTQAPEPNTEWSFHMGCVCSDGLPVNPEDMTDWNYCLDCRS